MATSTTTTVAVDIIAFLGAFWLGYAWGVAMEERRQPDIITECQAELPRNQQCKLIAVPEVKDND